MAIDRTKLLPPGQPGTPEGTVDNPGVPAGYVSEKQYLGLNKNINAIRGNLRAIADLLIRRGESDRQEDAQESKRLTRERNQSRIGDIESNLGTKLQQSLVKPIEKIGKSVKGPFAKIFDALKNLFLGLMGIKGIKALQAWSEGDTGELEKLKNELIQGLGVAAGVIAALKGGIPLLLGGLGLLVKGVFLGLMKTIALFANPAVWIGALLVASGIALSDYIKDVTGTGTGSFNPTSQKVINLLGSTSPASTLDLLRRELKEAEEEASKNLLGIDLSGKVAQLKQEIDRVEQAAVGKGPYAFAVTENLLDNPEDKKRFNEIAYALEQLKDYRANLSGIEVELKEAEPGSKNETALKEARREQIKKIYGALKVIEKSVTGMSAKGRDAFDLSLGSAKDLYKGKLDMFGLLQFPIASDINFLQIGERELPSMTDLDRISRSVGNIRTGQGPVIVPPTLPPLPESNQNSVNPNVSQTKAANVSYKTAAANIFNQPIEQIPDFNILPLFGEDEPNIFQQATPKTSTFAAFDIPSIMTYDPDNFYRDFAETIYQ